jgi:TRAP-type C4-dicarboxylate transport system permease small subunit
MMKLLLKMIDRINEAATVIMLVTTIVVIFLAVLSRYVFRNPIPWTEEVGRFAFIWLVFLGISIAERKQSHFRITFFILKASTYTQKRVWILSEIIIFLALLLLLKEGIQFARMGSHAISAVMELRLDFVYVALPLAVFLTLLNRVRNVIGILNSNDNSYYF